MQVSSTGGLPAHRASGARYRRAGVRQEAGPAATPASAQRADAARASSPAGPRSDAVAARSVWRIDAKLLDLVVLVGLGGVFSQTPGRGDRAAPVHDAGRRQPARNIDRRCDMDRADHHRQRRPHRFGGDRGSPLPATTPARPRMGRRVADDRDARQGDDDRMNALTSIQLAGGARASCSRIRPNSSLSPATPARSVEHAGQPLTTSIGGQR